MAGTLFHGKSFSTLSYTGMDGRTHYEIEPVDGGVEIVSVSTWCAFVEMASTLGVPRDIWPEYESSIDIPVDDMTERSRALKAAFENLDVPATLNDWLLELVVKCLRNGEAIAFAVT